MEKVSSERHFFYQKKSKKEGKKEKKTKESNGDDNEMSEASDVSEDEEEKVTCFCLWVTFKLPLWIQWNNEVYGPRFISIF